MRRLAEAFSRRSHQTNNLLENKNGLNVENETVSKIIGVEFDNEASNTYKKFEYKLKGNNSSDINLEHLSDFSNDNDTNKNNIIELNMR